MTAVTTPADLGRGQKPGVRPLWGFRVNSVGLRSAFGELPLLPPQPLHGRLPDLLEGERPCRAARAPARSGGEACEARVGRELRSDDPGVQRSLRERGSAATRRPRVRGAAREGPGRAAPRGVA